MNIYNSLPPELQNEIKYYVLEHPIAKIIKDEIQRLRCDEYYTFKVKNKRVLNETSPLNLKPNVSTGEVYLDFG